jgi:hypothetical protein
MKRLLLANIPPSYHNVTPDEACIFISLYHAFYHYVAAARLMYECRIERTSGAILW